MRDASSAVVDETDLERRETTAAAELLAEVLRAPTPMRDVIARAGGLERLARADAFEVAAWLEGRDLDAIGRPVHVPRPTRAAMSKARAVVAAFELGRRMETLRDHPHDELTSSAAVAAWANPRLASLPHEELWVLGLDGRSHLRAARCVAKGGLHGASVRATDPIRTALRMDVSAFVLVHNHPSGDPTPSREDIAFTARIAAGAEVVGVALLDHVVVARTGHASVARPPPRAASGTRAT